MACDVSWKSRLSTLNDENVLLKTQVDSVVKERENIKPEYQKLFNSIKATRTQYQKELNELIGHVNQKTYAYANGKNVNTKFDKSETSGTLLCVTPFPKSIAVKAKKVSITKGVESSNSVRRPKSKDTKSKNRVLKNTNDKSSSINVRKVSSSVSIDSNKREMMNSTVCQSNASVLKTKTVNAVNDSSNIVCVSCGKDVFMLFHEKCVTRYALSRDSRVKRALFTTPVVAKSKNLGATSVVAKSRLSFAKTPTTTNKVSSALSLSPNSSQSRTLSNYMKNKIATGRKWQKWCEYQQCFNWTPKSKTAQSLPSESKRSTSVQTKSKTPVTTQKWVAKLSTLPYAFVACDAGPGLNCSNFQDSSDEMNEILSHQDLDNLFGPLYEEYYAPSTFEVSNNSTSNTLDVEDTTSPSSIIVEDSDAPQIVTSSEEPITQESSTPVLETHSDEKIQEDVAELDGNTIMHYFENPKFKEVESSLNYQDPSNMHEFHQ
ncbi:hypothetical protein Tco_1154258 [Tanacetum coccineum]